MTDWLPIVQSIGIPAAILLLIVYAGWKVIPWIGDHVIVPLVARVISFIDKLEAGQDQMMERFREQGSDLKHIRSHTENGDHCNVTPEIARALVRWERHEAKHGETP